MLCDDLLTAYHNGTFQIIDDGISLFMRDLKAAQKFYISDETEEMATETLTTKPLAWAAAAEYCNPPYPITWLEYMKDTSVPGKLDAIRQLPTVRRLGFLVREMIKNQSFMITMAYNFKDKNLPPSISIISFMFSRDERFKKALMDLSEYYQQKTTGLSSEQIEQEQEFAKERFKDIYAAANSSQKWEAFNEKEREAATQIAKMFTIIPCPYLAGLQKRLYEHLGPQGSLEHNINAEADWIGESSVAPSIFILLACKNAVRIRESESFEKINKKRERNGKPQLQTYHILELDITNEEREAMKSEATGDGTKRRLHWVRGHFKHRKTGLFWWSPHLAGNKDLGFAKKDYAA